MQLTQERVIPELMNPENGMLKEHFARYRFAAEIACGRVLDIACGVGYGTEIISKSRNTKNILGVDIDKSSIQYARKKYSNKKTAFLTRDATLPNLSDEIGFYDTIVSFETIEHFQEDNEFIKNLQSSLNSGGTLVISTPFGRGKGKPCSNPYHVHQYKEEEFVDLLQCFHNLQMYYQIDETIEKRTGDKKYYLMVAVCKKIT